MPIWNNTIENHTPRYAIVDVEVGIKDHKIHDIGALRDDGAVFHKASKDELFDFLREMDYLCGHNIIHHDAKYLFGEDSCRWHLVDTLYLSPLLFPERPYHKLVKDDKLVSDQVNNPVNDCEKAKDLLWDEVARWNSLPNDKRQIYASLLSGQKEFEGFLNLVGTEPAKERLTELIRNCYEEKICRHTDLERLIQHYPCELAYALALVDTTDYRSITPGWVLRNYPEVEYVMSLLRHIRCKEGCAYCNTQLDVHYHLKAFYVGLTRANNRLFIHTNSDCFQHLPTDKYVIDVQQYTMPEEIVLQLSHRDVYLDFFKKPSASSWHGNPKTHLQMKQKPLSC